MRLAFLLVHGPGIHPLHYKNKNKDVRILYVPVVCLFLFILGYSFYIQGNREYSGTQPQPMSENNCWDHVPSSALLANAILLPRALPCHVHGLRHQHCVQGFSSLIAFQRQGAMMYANPADLVGHCRVTLGLLLLLTSLPCVYLDCTEEQSHLFGSPKC